MTAYDPQPPTDVASQDSRPARPRLPWWLRVTVVPFVALLVAIYSSLVYRVIPGVRGLVDDEGMAGSAFNILACATTAVAAVGLAALIMRYIDRRPLRETGLVWTRSSALLLGAGLGISILVVGGVALGMRLTGISEPVDFGWGRVGVGMAVMAVLAKLAQAFLLQGLPEELFFRGYILQTLRDRPVLALVSGTVVFGIIHLLSAGGQETALDMVLYLAWPTGFGFAAAALALRTRSLWAAVGIHAGSHVAGLLLSFTGTTAESPTGWVLVGLGYAVAGALILRGWRRTWQQPGIETVLDR